MKFNKTAALFTVAALSLNPLSAFAAEKQTPEFEQFNKNDVNGTVTVSVPDGYTADVSITFASPEGEALPYYSGKFAGGKEYSFDIEGRDNTADDYRYYLLSIKLEGGSFNRTSEAFTDTLNGTQEGSFLISDPNDHPDSFANYTYKLIADDTSNGKSWDVTESDTASKTVAFHINYAIAGDVTGDGKIDGVDASKVLTAYARSSANKDMGLTEEQKKIADVNGDNIIDAKDATILLSYYAYSSVHSGITFEDYLNSRNAAADTAK